MTDTEADTDAGADIDTVASWHPLRVISEIMGVPEEDQADLLRFTNLVLASTGQQLTSGTSVSINSYNILSNEFATFSAEQDARERGLREIADDIKVRLAIFFQRARRAQPSSSRQW